MKYQQVVNLVYHQPWAILPQMYAVIMDLVAFRASGGTLTEEEIQARIGAVSHPQQTKTGAVAVLPLHGVMAQRMNMMEAMSGGTSTELFGKAFTAAVADPAVGGIVIDIDSPGGSVFGVQELWQTVMNARGQKPVIAMANSMAASAAYWIATAADEIVVTPGGQMGSIGVITAHSDLSAQLELLGAKVTLISAGKKKLDGNPIEPLSDDARVDLQVSVNAYYASFVNAVAKGRNVAPGAVRSGFGEGGMVGAVEAVKQGMADRIGTLDVAIARAGGRKGFQAADIKTYTVDVLEQSFNGDAYWSNQGDCTEDGCTWLADKDGLCEEHATNKGVTLDCGCRVEAVEEEGGQVLKWWAACIGHEGASSGDMLHELAEQVGHRQQDEDTETRRRRLELQGLTRP